MSEQQAPYSEPSPSEATQPDKASFTPTPEKTTGGWFWPAVLFLATCASTCFVGAAHWNPTAYLGDFRSAWQVLQANWPKGLLYMGAVMGILGMHELGHFLAARRHRIPTSYPYFLPLPVAPFGTLGAVIGLADTQSHRRQLFDLGVAGPLAGLLVTFGVAWIGLRQLPPPPPTAPHGLLLHPPLALQWLLFWQHPEWIGQSGWPLQTMNPYLMAAWVGLWITGLNLLPIGQLDGGHVAYALLGRRAHLLARSLLAAAIAYILIAERYEWVLMVVLLCLLGPDHPPTTDDSLPLDPRRRLLAWAVIAMPFFCFTPQPISLR
jgi:membrane-associated protease RseP (regulator of RpoE activity)